MTMYAGNALNLLERALLQTGNLVAGVKPEQASLPTPCSGWDVNALLAHMVVQDLDNFTLAARAQTPDWAQMPHVPESDWSSTFQARAQALLSTWREVDPEVTVAGPGGQDVPLMSRADQQITELSVHAWDLARATGQPVELDSDVASYALGWGQHMLRPAYRGPDLAFGAEVPVPEDAPVQDRLAGWFGRDPGWEPASDVGNVGC
ncbi:TIGR03086 family metal-binding protein [Arthrobacter sp. H14-L1]|uniref:TIGR03086 family metal-binding protein n=1 Tax=Arthrobacter sp. H14-L1 TaxID=2996697 RepID=UPI0022705DB0|nr:TIGR03086 family metal-binding protein [Arthrobacter sp. H14-L1]MCY0904708.1 TIGR03086 family metal-binding protein [Arthrobacter sp. H14-L1]